MNESEGKAVGGMNGLTFWEWCTLPSHLLILGTGMMYMLLMLVLIIVFLGIDEYMRVDAMRLMVDFCLISTIIVYPTFWVFIMRAEYIRHEEMENELG
jgi:hypothetical protein